MQWTVFQARAEARGPKGREGVGLLGTGGSEPQKKFRCNLGFKHHSCLSAAYYLTVMGVTVFWPGRAQIAARKPDPEMVGLSPPLTLATSDNVSFVNRTSYTFVFITVAHNQHTSACVYQHHYHLVTRVHGLCSRAPVLTIP